MLLGTPTSLSILTGKNWIL